MTSSQICKRTVDIILAAALLILLLPVLFLAMLLQLILEGRPLFYNSVRLVGTSRSITVYKFRTMVRDATSPRYRLQERFMRGGYLDIPLTCEVFTPLGRWLERTQCVEVPQLLNVLVGQMSLIGNRPLPSANVQLLRNVEGWEKRFDSPAGISGIAQVVGKLTLEPAERLGLEATYSEVYQHGNIIKCDLMILLYTVVVVALGKGMPLSKAHELLRSALPLKDAEATAQVFNQSVGG